MGVKGYFKLTAYGIGVFLFLAALHGTYTAIRGTAEESLSITIAAGVLILFLSWGSVKVGNAI